MTTLIASFNCELWSILLLLMVTLCGIWVVRSWMEAPQNIPPIPVRPFPILGHIPYLVNPRRKLMERHKRVGDLFSIYLGLNLVVVISSYDLLREAFVKKADYFSDRHHEGIIPPLKVPKGVVGSSGKAWKENRTVTLNLLRSFGMGKHEMAENIIEEVSAYLTELSATSGKPINPKDLTSRSVSNVVCRFLIGKRFEYDDPEYANLLLTYDKYIKHALATGLLNWFPILKYLPGDPLSFKPLLKSDNEVLDFSGKLIDNITNKTNQDCNEDNFIASYLDEMEKKKASGMTTHLNRENLDRCIPDLLTAGTETTTTTLLWFYLYMVHYPMIQEKIHEEIDQVTGGSRLPCVADKTKMNFLHATILEVQRIASIVPLGLLHRVSEECTLKGHIIPKDTLIIPHLDAVHFDETIWGDPHTFRPGRFLNKNGDVVQLEHFIAFSLGRRICLGEALARMELFLFLAITFQRFKVTPVNPDQLPPLTDEIGLTYSPTDFKIVFMERH